MVFPSRHRSPASVMQRTVRASHDVKDRASVFGIGSTHTLPELDKGYLEEIGVGRWVNQNSRPKQVWAQDFGLRLGAAWAEPHARALNALMQSNPSILRDLRQDHTVDRRQF